MSDSQRREKTCKLLQNNKIVNACSWRKYKMIKEMKVIKQKPPYTDGSFWLVVTQLDKASSVHVTRLDCAAICGRAKSFVCLSVTVLRGHVGSKWTNHCFKLASEDSWADMSGRKQTVLHEISWNNFLISIGTGVEKSRLFFLVAESKILMKTNLMPNS